MSSKYLGGFITKNVTEPSIDSAVGIWTLSQQATYAENYKWPGSSLPVLPGEVIFETAGTYTWIAPEGVTSVSAVVVGGGGGGPKIHDSNGGGGGALAYKNNITVVPGVSYTLTVGAGGSGAESDNTFGLNGGDSWFINNAFLFAQGGRFGPGDDLGPTPRTSGFIGDGGGEGGAGTGTSGGGCGAGGYSGNGGDAVSRNSIPSAAPPGGGGSAGYYPDNVGGFGGGGVGLFGQGSSGGQPFNTNPGGYGLGGSGGENGVDVTIASGSKANGGKYGGGGGNGELAGYSNASGGNGGVGAVRIIWSGTTEIVRAFPSTNTGPI